MKNFLQWGDGWLLFFTWHQGTTWSKATWLFGWESLILSHPCANFDTFVLWKWRLNTCILSHGITRPHYQKAIWLGKWEPLNLNNHCIKLDAYRFCKSGDIKLLFCYVISHEHILDGTYNFINGSST